MHHGIIMAIMATKLLIWQNEYLKTNGFLRKSKVSNQRSSHIYCYQNTTGTLSQVASAYQVYQPCKFGFSRVNVRRNSIFCFRPIQSINILFDLILCTHV